MMIMLLIGLVVGSFACLVVLPAVRMVIFRHEIRETTRVRRIALG
jgi:hypothetical protein